MSRYPGNPLWSHDNDVPVVIMTRRDWDEAIAAGHVTPEHVLVRLKNIADYAFDNISAIGYDSEGFVTALTAEGLPRPGGVTLYVYTHDHPPPHVHIKLRDHPDVKLRISLETGEYLDTAPRGLSTKKLRGFQRAVRECHPILAGWWENYHGGDPVVLA